MNNPSQPSTPASPSDLAAIEEARALDAEPSSLPPPELHDAYVDADSSIADRLPPVQGIIHPADHPTLVDSSLPFIKEMIPSLTSLVIHLVLLLLLALVVKTNRGGADRQLIAVSLADAGDDLNEFEIDLPASGGTLDTIQMEATLTQEAKPLLDSDSELQVELEIQLVAPEMSSDLSSLIETSSLNPLISSDTFREIGIGDRNGPNREDLVAKRGGTGASEEAVDRALAYLAKHQLGDGSWSLRLTEPPCGGKCTHGTPDINPYRYGATGLSLLCFLGRGNTQREGPYQEEVRAGIYFLVSNAIQTPNGLRFAGLQSQFAMYEHGIATLALCEAYQLTEDEDLREICQLAVDYIAYAQHSDGSWNYDPKSPGDLSIACWQMMALKSASAARLRISDYTLQAFDKYLDRVSEPDHVRYRYRNNPPSPTMTSVGILMRFYRGWGLTDPKISRGLGILIDRGPSPSDAYFNYYATQDLYHVGGRAWQLWNDSMRDYLVESQAKRGHESGSWFFEEHPDLHNGIGGRLYVTAMCTLTLEIYYRYLPIHEGIDADEDFKL